VWIINYSRINYDNQLLITQSNNTKDDKEMVQTVQCNHSPTVPLSANGSVGLNSQPARDSLQLLNRGFPFES
jgi:hypothetical protein